MAPSLVTVRVKSPLSSRLSHALAAIVPIDARTVVIPAKAAAIDIVIAALSPHLLRAAVFHVGSTVTAAVTVTLHLVLLLCCSDAGAADRHQCHSRDDRSALCESTHFG